MPKNKLKEELNGDPLWGLPKQISDELVDSYRLTPIRWLGHWLFMIVMCGGFAVGAWIWAICESILRQNAIETARNIDGFAYDTNFGIGLLIGLFVWIFLSGVIVSLITMFTPMPIKGALFLSTQSDVSENAPKMPLVGPLVENKGSLATASDLINDYSGRIVRKLGRKLAPFALLVIGISYAELSWFNIISSKGLHTSVPWSMSDKVHAWRDAEAVKLGCNQTDDGASLIYEVIWPDGKNKRLPTDTHINGQDWLTNVESVDAEFSEGDAIFERWTWLERNALHPKCLRSFYAEQGPDGKSRIDRLLRIGELD